MALIKEDGTIVTGANSYTDLADANAYFTAKGELGWAGDDSFKEQNLINATTAIDALYGERYISRIVDEEPSQSLLWPREFTNDRNQRRINEDTIPNALKNAQMEMALLAQNGVDLFPEGNKANDITQSSVSIGDISESTTFQKLNKEQATYDGFREIELILRPILKPKTKRMVFSI